MKDFFYINNLVEVILIILWETPKSCPWGQNNYLQSRKEESNGQNLESPETSVAQWLVQHKMAHLGEVLKSLKHKLNCVPH